MKLRLATHWIMSIVFVVLSVICITWTLNLWMALFLFACSMYCFSSGEKICKARLPKPTYVVCAANRLASGLIVCGARHHDMIMNAQIAAAGETHVGEEQGFLDSKGNFLTREQALWLAWTLDQIRYKGPGFDAKKILYSENLY